MKRRIQLLEANRLRQVVVHACSKARVAVALHRVRSHGDDPRQPCALPLAVDASCCLEAVHLRHLDVHEHDVVRLQAHGLHRLDAVPRKVGAVSQLLEEQKGESLVQRVVLSDENPQRRTLGGSFLALGPRSSMLCARTGFRCEDRHERRVELRGLDRLRQVAGERDT
jgi:hypothetical protein